MSFYKDLLAWQKSFDLVKKIYLLTNEIPSDERFGLISQTRRAAVSIPSNIAEGYRRRTMNDRRQFFYISFGSASELETQLLLAKELYPITTKTWNESNDELQLVLRLLNGLCASCG